MTRFKQIRLRQPLLLAVIFAALTTSAPFAYGDISFTLAPYFTLDNGPQSNGAGTFLVEAAPAGSGIGLVAPIATSAGFSTGGGYLIHYVAAQADLGGSVFVNWTADRNFTSSGEIARNMVSLDAQVQLVSSLGGSASIYYSAETVHQNVGGSTGAIISNQFALSQEEPTVSIHDSATGSTFSVFSGGADVLRQDILFSLNPSVAGQEFLISLAPGLGLTSTTTDPSVTSSVPEPETYALLIAGLGLLGFHARRRKLKAADQLSTRAI